MQPARRQIRKSSDFLADVARRQQQIRSELLRPAPPPRPDTTGCAHLGTRLDTRAPLYLNPDSLIGPHGSHVMIMAPTGGGKTSLTRQMLRPFLQWSKPLAIWADDPKCEAGGLYSSLEEDCAARSLEDRTILCDSSNRARLPRINPFRRNGLDVADQAMWILAAMMAAWEQERLTETPLLWQWMFNAVALTLERNGSFTDAFELLHEDRTETRRRFLEQTADPLLRREWERYERMPIAQRRDATASAYRRLLPVRANPTVMDFVGHPDASLDLEEDFLKPGGILLTGFPRGRPLPKDLTILLRSVVMQTIISHAFHVPLGERPPLLIVLDEAEHALEHDTGVIETILNEGRSLGIHLCLCFHTLAQVERKTPALLASVLSNCRIKILGGEIADRDLDILVPEIHLREWHPYLVRDQITGHEVMPVEELRAQVSLSEGEQESLARTAGVALTSAIAKGITRQQSRTKARGNTRSHMHGYGSAHTDSHGDGFHEGDSVSDSCGMVIGPEGEPLSTYDADSSGSTSGWSSMDASSDTESESESWGRSRSAMRSVTRGIASTLTQTISRAASSSIAETVGRNRQHGITLGSVFVPYLREKVMSRAFLSSADFLTVKKNLLKTLERGDWALKVPYRLACLFRMVWPLPSLLEGGARLGERLAEFRHRVFSKSYYPSSLPENSSPYLPPQPAVELPKPSRNQGEEDPLDWG